MPNEQVWRQKEGSGWHGTALWLTQLICRGRQLFELWKVVHKLSTWHSKWNWVVFCWKISKDSISVVIWTAFHKLSSAVRFWHRNTECSKWWCASIQAAWLVWCQIHSPGQERLLLRGQCHDSWCLVWGTVLDWYLLLRSQCQKQLWFSSEPGSELCQCDASQI